MGLTQSTPTPAQRCDRSRSTPCPQRTCDQNQQLFDVPKASNQNHINLRLWGHGIQQSVVEINSYRCRAPTQPISLCHALPIHQPITTKSIFVCRGTAFNNLWSKSTVIDAVPLHNQSGDATPCRYANQSQPNRFLVVGALRLWLICRIIWLTLTASISIG